MKASFIIASLALLSASLHAQLTYPGLPVGWPTAQNVERSATVEMPTVDVEALRTEDVENDQHKEFGYRFGVEMPTSVDLLDAPQFEARTTHGNATIFRTVVRCPGAVSMNFAFEDFFMPKGSRMFIYALDGSSYLGAYDYRSNSDGGSFAVGLIYADEVIIEIQHNTLSDKTPRAVLNEVVHGYRDILNKWHEEADAIEEALRGPFGNSGNCNVNVACPEAIDWQTESHSVALIVDGGSASCTGALVNNTSQDGTPYFLTANHCLGGENNWVFYFNHESANCTGSTGPTSDSVSGSDLKASNGGSDFALLELDETPPSSFNVQYAGWDYSDNSVDGGIGIHHPSGDVKKICFEDNNLTQENWGGASTWRIADWDLGVTEPGSSGSPLFDPNHRIIGQLYGGSAACSGSDDNDQPDYYGRFGVSWDGPSASSRLKDWLDPGGNDVTVLDGWPEGAVVFAVDPAANGFQNVPDNLCDAEGFAPVFRIKNNGTDTWTSAQLFVTYNGSPVGPIEWTGSLASGEIEDVELPVFYPQEGANTLAVVVDAEGDENDFNNAAMTDVVLHLGHVEVNIEVMTDDYGYETYWELRDDSGSVVASGGNTEVGANGGGAYDAANDDDGAYANNSLYESTYTISESGCYTFLIVDDYADGICCDYGDGYYTITDGDGDVLASGSTFGDTSEHLFGMSDVASDIAVQKQLQLSAYPNPASEILYVQSSRALQHVSLRDATGRLVLSQPATTKNTTQLSIQHLPAGIYILQAESKGQTTSLRVIIQ